MYNKSLLIINNDIVLLNNMYKTIKPLFKTIYREYNGKDGYISAITHKPDIILISSSLQNIDCFELVVDIKLYFEDINIIVYGYKTDDYLLLKSLSMSSVTLIPQNNKTETISVINNEIKNIFTNPLDNDLKYLIHKELLVHNNYKGIEIQSICKIIAIKDNSFLAKVSNVQLFALKYNKYVIIEYNGKYIISILKKVNNNNIIELYDSKYIDFIKRDKLKRLKTDDKFKIGIFYNNQHLDIQTVDISFNYCSILVDKNIVFQINQPLDLTLGFNVQRIGVMSHETEFVKVFASGILDKLEKLNNMEQYSNKQKLILKIKVKKSGESNYIKYLKSREVEIIQELKRHK